MRPARGPLNRLGTSGYECMHVPRIWGWHHAACLFSLLAAFNNAGAQAMPGAREFLESVVKADFDGDAFPRIGHVDKKPGPPDPDKDNGPSFEVYMLDSDPLIKARRIRAVRRRQEDVASCARFVDGKWMLVDPPLPRVSKTALLDTMEKSVALASGNAAHPGSCDPRAATTAPRAFESLRGSLR